MNHTGRAARVGVTPIPAGSHVDRAAAAELAPNTCSPPAVAVP